MNEVVIKAEALSKIYKLYKSPKSRLKEALHPFGKKYHREFYALRDINLEIRRGECVGILGMNGAGKSTLLKAITGVISPTSGSLNVKGNISALLELGSGFNPEFSGYDNIFFYGALMGFSREEMKAKIKEISDFADIGEFIYQPLKTYSSGMKARLAFAVSTSINPEILILDEVLSVGDAFFKAKCTMRMQSMIKNGDTTVLFVSHDVGSVRSVCERCILLEGGRLILDGRTEDVVNAYLNKQYSSRQKVIEKQMRDPKVNSIAADNVKLNEIGDTSVFLKKSAYNRLQNGKAEFLNVQLLTEDGEILDAVNFGQTVVLRMILAIHEDLDSIGFGYHIRDKNSVDVIYGSSGIEGMSLSRCRAGDVYSIRWKFNLKILHGLYSIVAVASIPIDLEAGIVDFCDMIPIACQFEMQPRSERRTYGYVYLDNQVTVDSIKRG